MGYLANFMVYTLAMVGIIVVALLVFKNSTTGGITGGKSKYLKVLDTLNIAPRKTLYIVSTGREKFLIAGDVDKTTLISKLLTSEDCGNVSEVDCQTLSRNDSTHSTLCEERERGENMQSAFSFKETMTHLSKPSYMDKSNIGIKSSMLSSKNSGEKSVLRSLAERIR